jgi:hyperosmotically inducible protein
MSPHTLLDPAKGKTMATRRYSKASSTLLITLCTAALSVPMTSMAADPDYSTRGSSGSTSSSGSDMPPSGNTGSTTNEPSSSSGTTTGTGSPSDMDNTNRPSSGSYAKDAYITAKVKAALARDKEVTARNIKVETDGQGVVTLSGQAKTQAEADKAVADARSVDGVTSVTNNLQIR